MNQTQPELYILRAKKMKTDNAGDGSADFVADLFNCSTPTMVDKVDNHMPGMGCVSGRGNPISGQAHTSCTGNN